MKTYLDLLNKLLTFGPKIIEVWPLILQVIALVKEIAAKFGVEAPADGGLALTANTPEEDAALGALAVRLNADGSENLIDLSFLRTVWELAKLSPEVLAFLNAALDFIGGLLAKKG